MSASTAIGMVSESLRNLLVEEMTLTPPVAVTILAPDETGGDRRINLFLYRMLENATLKNLDWQVKRGNPVADCASALVVKSLLSHDAVCPE